MTRLMPRSEASSGSNTMRGVTRASWEMVPPQIVRLPSRVGGMSVTISGSRFP